MRHWAACRCTWPMCRPKPRRRCSRRSRLRIRPSVTTSGSWSTTLRSCRARRSLATRRSSTNPPPACWLSPTSRARTSSARRRWHWTSPQRWRWIWVRRRCSWARRSPIPRRSSRRCRVPASPSPRSRRR
nr:MAG TPA: hypothetical protein [Caudoviricetes sp.]